MKKVIILQLLGKSYGGIWQVNKTVGNKLIELGYDVIIINLRDNINNLDSDKDSKMKMFTINKTDNWDEIPRKIDVLKGKSTIFKYIKEKQKLNKDFNNLKKLILKENPDYIINTHYQLLDSIPKDYLARTIHEQHTSFKATFSHFATRRTLFKYNGKINILWLCKKTCEAAIKKGYKNCSYIYNAVRFNCNTSSQVNKNKKLVTISRLSYEKRIDLMIEIVNNIFQDKRLNDWTLEIYGDGPEFEKLKSLTKTKKKIKLMGVTNNPKNILLKSSINLNTSSFEGFPMSILEANECGIPTVSLNFGESAEECILNNKTGIIAENIDEYEEKLKELMLNQDILLKMSKECKEFNSNFKIDKIINDWLDIFNKIDEKINKI